MTEPTKAHKEPAAHLTLEELAELNQYFGEHGELPHGVEEALLEMATNCLELRAHLSESRGELRASERQGLDVDERHEVWVVHSPGGTPCDVRLWQFETEACVSEAGETVVRYTPSQPAPSADAAMARWVPVAERLPAPYEIVQFVTGPGIGANPWDRRVGDRTGGPSWIWRDYTAIDRHGEADIFEDHQVAYWAPLLPAPPEVKP